MCSCLKDDHAKLAKHYKWEPKTGETVRLSITGKTAAESFPNAEYHFEVAPANKGRLQDIADADGKVGTGPVFKTRMPR